MRKDVVHLTFVCFISPWIHIYTYFRRMIYPRDSTSEQYLFVHIAGLRHVMYCRIGVPCQHESDRLCMSYVINYTSDARLRIVEYLFFVCKNVSHSAIIRYTCLLVLVVSLFGISIYLAMCTCHVTRL